MTPAFVAKHASGAIGASGSTVPCTVATGSTPGNFLFAVISTNGGTTDDITSITDNSTQPGDPNVWQKMPRQGANVGGNTGIMVAFCKVTRAALAGDVVTYTNAVADSRMSVIICEYSGFIHPVVLATVLNTNGGTSTTMTTNAVNAAAPCLAIAPLSNNTGANAGQTTTSPINGYTIRLGANNSGGGSVQHEATILDKVVAATGTVITAGATDAGTTGWLLHVYQVIEGFGLNFKSPRGRYAS